MTLRRMLIHGLLFIAVLTFGLAQVAPSSASNPQPNILFIAVDDLRPELGCYGVEAIKTPHMDAFAASAVTFQRAYCQLAVCNPSRVSLLTGMRPDSSRVWDLATRFRHTVPDVVTLPQQFKKHGYYAVSHGKIFHNPWPDNVSWSEPHHWPKSSLWSAEAKQRHREYKKKMLEAGKSQNAIDRMRPQATEIVDLPDEQHIDGAIAQQAINSLKRLATRDEPFFLAAGFVRPHLPFVVPRKYWKLYQENEIPIAKNGSLPHNSPAFAMNTMYELRDYLDFDETPSPHKGSLTLQQQRRLKHGYYASVSFIDALVGRLLKELETQGLTENTIVVLWGDHGWKLGEHNSWCKQSNYEIDARVPLIIRNPAGKGNGKNSAALVEFVDLYPTLCDLAGVPLPKHLDGKSMKSLLENPGTDFKEAAFSQFRRQNGNTPLMGYAMRTDRYRYVEWQDRRNGTIVATELYDHQSDSGETTNLSRRPEYQKMLTTLNLQMWTTLPPPPKYVPPKRARPQVIFRNDSKHPLTLFWVKPDGTERKQATIEPKSELLQNSTLEHVFRVKFPNGKVQSFRVNKRKQTFVIKPTAGKKAGPNSPNGKESENQNSKTDLKKTSSRPNFVFLMADDWSWPHAGILGDPVVKTPNFDRVAKEGVLFENAFVSTPSCTPSRLSILSGQHHWRLKEGDSLGGSLREEYPVYTELLKKADYRIGRFGKGVWPSKHTFRNRDSFGERFKSFDQFIETRKPGESFCYWHGGQDPHRPYDLHVGVKSGIKLADIKVPGCLPDNETVRSDVADYLWEVQRFDSEVGEILATLKRIGELDNTIIVVSGDNGMPFPRCKATLYDQGTRVPLAVRWGSKVSSNRTVSDFVNLCDFAPTFLAVAGLTVPEQMTGESLLPILNSKESGQIDPKRTFALTGMEKHVYLYPARAIRTKDFLYIRNFNADKWPTGEVNGHNPEYDFAKQPWPTEPGAFSFNIDPSPSKQFLRLFRSDKATEPFVKLALNGHPNDELYDLRQDPDQLNNVASEKRYAADRVRLRKQLNAELVKSKDPRVRKTPKADSQAQDN
jgi:arylsulfatase A-like enzyme